MKLHHYVLTGWVLLASLTACKHDPNQIGPKGPDTEIPAEPDLFYLDVTPKDGRRVRLVWDAADGHPVSYQIMRASAKDRKDDPKTLTFATVGETQALSFYDDTVAPGFIYIYKVKAVFTSERMAETLYVSVETPLMDADTKAVETYTNIATATGGKMYRAEGEKVLPSLISQIIRENGNGATTDVILLMDNTGSMGDYIAAVKETYNKIIDGLPASARLGAGGFRDRGDLYVLRFQDLSPDFSVARKFINNMTASGGGDQPEAVYDAIWGSITQATWVNKRRIVILVTDAGPQEGKNTDHSGADVVAKCKQMGVTINLYPILVETEDEYGNNG